jgi:hypothetical protein
MGEAEIAKLMKIPMKKKLKELKARQGNKKMAYSEYNWKKLNFENFFNELKVEI